MSMRMPYGYVPIPNGVQGVGETEFIQCGMPGSSPAGPPVALHEGSEFTIIDAQKSRGGAATFADVVAGSGTSHYKVSASMVRW